MIVLCSIIAFFIGAEVEYQLNKAIKQKTDKKARYIWKKEDGTEIEITDLTKFNYSIYNVENITSFKNKVYISNYEESNFNEYFNNIAKNVAITLEQVSKNDGYGEYTVEPTVINNKKRNNRSQRITCCIQKRN